MKKSILVAILACSSAAIAAALLGACSGDDTNGGAGGTHAGGDHSVTPVADGGPGADTGADTGPGTDGGDGGASNPSPPTLGAQIDRMGRPAINTALDHVFDTNATTKGQAKDTYNADKSPASWVTNVPEFAKNLAIYDGLDTNCGNQAGYDPQKGYTRLAGLLAGDMLWLNTAGTECKRYLGVELNALGILANQDCGGRTPSYDVIDVTYSAVAIGALSGVTDGINAPASPPGATFPYLATPH